MKRHLQLIWHHVDADMVQNAIKTSRSARRLGELGLTNDVEFCLKRNIYDTVPVYENGRINLIK